MNPVTIILKGSKNVNDVQERLLTYLRELRENRERVGFVSGTVFSGGVEHFTENIKKLDKYTNKIRKNYSFLIFSAVDVFYSGLFNKLPESKEPLEIRRPKFMRFWENVMNSGHITDLFMAPGWERSEGAVMEHKRCKEKKVAIHYPE